MFLSPMSTRTRRPSLPPIRPRSAPQSPPISRKQMSKANIGSLSSVFSHSARSGTHLALSPSRTAHTHLTDVAFLLLKRGTEACALQSISLLNSFEPWPPTVFAHSVARKARRKSLSPVTWVCRPSDAAACSTTPANWAFGHAGALPSCATCLFFEAHGRTQTNVSSLQSF